jgi:hypothetical protein
MWGGARVATSRLVGRTALSVSVPRCARRPTRGKRPAAVVAVSSSSSSLVLDERLRHAYASLMGAALLLLSSGTVALCEEKLEKQESAEEEPSDANSGANEDDGDSEHENDERIYIQEDLDPEEDPVYWNIPEEDPWTDCFLCRTHRQGPCRPQWRSFEFCAKDHAEKGAQVCAPFVEPFQKCWMQHLNLYLLIAMTLHQEVVDMIQEDFPPGKRQSDNEWQPTIDWREWEAVLDEEKSLRATVQHVSAMFENIDATTPVWKVYDSRQEEPWVVNVEGQIPAHHQRRILRFVYAVDQENRVLGFVECHPTYETYMVAKEGGNANPESHRLLISMVPGLTQSIQLQALYVIINPETSEAEDTDTVQNGTDESIHHDSMEHVDPDSVEEVEGAILFESEWIPLPGNKGTAPGSTP